MLVLVFGCYFCFCCVVCLEKKVVDYLFFGFIMCFMKSIVLVFLLQMKKMNGWLVLKIFGFFFCIGVFIVSVIVVVVVVLVLFLVMLMKFLWMIFFIVRFFLLEILEKFGIRNVFFIFMFMRMFLSLYEVLNLNFGRVIFIFFLCMFFRMFFMELVFRLFFIFLNFFFLGRIISMFSFLFLQGSLRV